MFHDWIEFFEFMPGDSDSKTPMDFDLLFVAPFFPRADLATQHISVVQPATKALSRQHTNFDFRHVEPTGVLGRVMELQAVEQPPRFIRGKCLIQGGPRVGVQVVEHQTNAAQSSFVRRAVTRTGRQPRSGSQHIK